MYSKTIHFLVGSLAALVLFTSVPVHAAGLTQTQVQAILSLLQSFGADQNTINNVQAALSGQAAPGSQSSGQTGAGNSCFGFSHNLYIGATDATTGGEVTKLQQMLGITNPTGYFGPATRQAVINWQKAHGISAVGVVGPSTRAAMVCGASAAPAPTTDSSSTNKTTSTAPVPVITAPTATSSPATTSNAISPTTAALNSAISQVAAGNRIAAVPVSGASLPLVAYAVSPQFGNGYVDFGDGSAMVRVNDTCTTSTNTCGGVHNYSAPGAYTVTLRDSAKNRLTSIPITVTGN